MSDVKEIWKNIEGYDNYSISSLKNVMNTKTNTLMMVNKNNQVRLSKDGKQNKYTISSLMHKYFRGYDDFTGEIWKKIEGFDYVIYEVSTFGRVRNKDSGNISVAKPKKKTGYYVVGLTYEKGKNAILKLVHRLVGEAFIPNPENLPMVHHKDTIRSNNHISNLQWCTNLENTQSKNTVRPIGCVFKDYDGFRAQLQVNQIRYTFYCKTKEECTEWLEARRIEVLENKPLTNIECIYDRKKK
jgi:hypothetical protein